MSQESTPGLKTMSTADLVFKTLQDVSNCKYLYDMTVEGAVMCVAHQNGITLAPGQKEEAVQKVKEALPRLGFNVVGKGSATKAQAKPFGVKRG
jgi:hypothetical protein